MHITNAAYCYTRSSVVGLLVMTATSAKAIEPQVSRFGGGEKKAERMGPRNHVHMIGAH